MCCNHYFSFMFWTGVYFIVLKLSAQVCRQKTIFRHTFLNLTLFHLFKWSNIQLCLWWVLTSWLGPLVKFRQQSRLVKLCSYTLNVKRPVLVNPLMPSLSYLTHLIQKRSPVQQIWYNLQLIYANYYLINLKKKSWRV